ncbi:MAG: hypothetical protein KKB21_01505 [Nanoarchaeota archaeon]|nr:hypothetical protein [Nanoarchaeota archaeon]MBU4086232.1 hypothetical protein [Nanoarchaeota archaeon]
MGIRTTLIGLVLGISVLGCADVREGLVVNKQYVAAKEGTKIISYPPAALIGSLLLHLATKSPEKHNLFLECYDFERGKMVNGKFDAGRAAYNSTEVGDWFIHASDRERFRELKDFSERVGK